VKPVRFSGHAIAKLSLLRSWGFVADGATVTEAIIHQQTFEGYLDRMIAQTVLDVSHVLRVIYEE
jgi:hypothetical protein